MLKLKSPKSRLIAVTTMCATALVIIVFSVIGFDANSKRSTININNDQLAIHGYDTVAYFTEGKAVKGSRDYIHNWQGARWQFASSTNRDLFKINPERYSPRYGGYCSMGLAMGEYSDIDPEIWTIVDGKLYLNRTKKIRDDYWLKGQQAYIVAADINWKKYREELRINDSLK